jgi:hypothetical protein
MVKLRELVESFDRIWVVNGREMIYVDLLSEVDPSMDNTVAASELPCPKEQSRAGQTEGLM